jgi:hypothetical protein
MIEPLPSLKALINRLQGCVTIIAIKCDLMMVINVFHQLLKRDRDQQADGDGDGNGDGEGVDEKSLTRSRQSVVTVVQGPIATRAIS